MQAGKDLIRFGRMANYSISMEEFTRRHCRDRVETLKGGLSEKTPFREVVQVPLLSLAETPRNTLLDKFPCFQIAKVALKKSSEVHRNIASVIDKSFDKISNQKGTKTVSNHFDLYEKFRFKVRFQYGKRKFSDLV